jgi:hypothetical protein
MWLAIAAALACAAGTVPRPAAVALQGQGPRPAAPPQAPPGARSPQAPPPAEGESRAALGAELAAAAEWVELRAAAAAWRDAPPGTDPALLHHRWRVALRNAESWARVSAARQTDARLGAELAWIERYVAAELVLADRRPWRQAPTWHLQRAADRLRAVPAPEDGVEAWRELTAALTAVPSILAGAREALTFVPREWQPLAADASREFAATLRTPLLDAAEVAGLDPEGLGALDQAQARAARAAEVFALWVEGELEARDELPSRLSRTGWLRLAERAAGTRLALEDIELDLGRLLAETDGPPAAARAAEDPSADEALQQGAELGRAVAVELGVLPLPGPDPRAVRRLLGSPLLPAIAARGPAADGHFELALQEPGGSWPAAAAEARWRALGPEPLRAAGMALATVGQGWFATLGGTSALDLEALSDPGGDLGLGLFAAHWLLSVGGEQNPLVRRPGIAAALRRLRHEAAARAVASLELHALGAPLEDVQARLERNTGWDSWTARQELRAVLVEPERGLAILRARELEALERRLRLKLGAARALPTLLEVLRRHPWAAAADLERLAKR